MNAVTSLVTATTLAAAAWRLGELDRYIGDPDIPELIFNAVEAADEELTGGISPQRITQHARALVLARHDGEMSACERQAAASLVDEIEAGDRDRNGVVVGYTKHWGV